MISEPGLHWNQAYKTGKQNEERAKPSNFALVVAEQLNSDDTLLELGCGVGVDAAYFATKVLSVTAVDFAESQIRSNQEAFNQSNLIFETVDISQGLHRFDDASFTAVYARRSLHYFDNETTKNIFQEIHRVLTPNGRLFFEVKSAKDPHAGQQAELGDVRQFFGDDELREYLADFEIDFQEENMANDFYGYPSVFLTCWARKK